MPFSLSVRVAISEVVVLPIPFWLCAGLESATIQSATTARIALDPGRGLPSVIQKALNGLRTGIDASFSIRQRADILTHPASSHAGLHRVLTSRFQKE